MSSAAIVCNREFGDGQSCGKPIVPVFGAWPEECTSCTSRVLVSSKDAREAVEQIIEEHKGRLRNLVIAAAVPGNPWRIDGLELRARFEMLEKLEADLKTRQLMRALAASARANEKTTAGETTNEVVRTRLGYMWNAVSQERAVQLKQAGFETRFIGVGWEVKVS
jgi:hypothetical protein